MLGTYYVPDSWAREIRSIGPPMAPPVFFSRVKPWFGAGRWGSSQKPVWRVVSFGREGLQPNPLFGRRRMGRAGLRRRCEAAFRPAAAAGYRDPLCGRRGCTLLRGTCVGVFFIRFVFGTRLTELRRCGSMATGGTVTPWKIGSQLSSSRAFLRIR